MGKYFTMQELCASATASALNIPNTPPASVSLRIERLISNLLDPLREVWGNPLYVSSGYRSPALNAAVGGAFTSQHLRGEAADITAGSPARNRKLFQLLLLSGLSFDQLIDEKGYSWLHVSWCENNRHQVLHM